MIALNNVLDVIAEEFVHFDSELPEYRTNGGVIIQGNKVTSPTIMWVKALDILMEKLRITGIDFDNVRAISGCGQVSGGEITKYDGLSFLILFPYTTTLLVIISSLSDLLVSTVSA